MHYVGHAGYFVPAAVKYENPGRSRCCLLAKARGASRCARMLILTSRIVSLSDGITLSTGTGLTLSELSTLGGIDAETKAAA
jgi:hypothetical protein